ncbi:hypothetical protein [Secundilactobacillus kimchicus]|uniref:hypothetical protein n=1 Tax=Secundilactobacillus kimchicus TaxID=528209 RepID=UPI0006CFC897|nr:hypothetical protein [Secundilactobacillus kimchicus]
MNNEIRRFETIGDLFNYYAAQNVDAISLDVRSGTLTFRTGRKLKEVLVHGGRLVSSRIQLPVIRNVAQRRVLLNFDPDAFIELLSQSGIAFFEIYFSD